MKRGTSPSNFHNLVPNELIRQAVLSSYLNLSTEVSQEVFWAYVSNQAETTVLHELRLLPQSEVYSLYGEAFMTYIGGLFDSVAGTGD
jgi:hypothetical protein